MLLRLLRSCSVVCALALIPGSLAPAWARSQPQAATPVLLELFTSEGCSSCPPADRLLIDLVRTQPVPGVRIVALSEHVDYWNHLGWRDPFSDSLFSRRQEQYAGGTPDGSYTPQMFVDGEAGFVGSDRAQALRAIQKSAAAPKAALSLTWTSVDRTAVNVTVPADARTARARVLLAISEDGLRSSVKRGENEGHELTHDGVTRKLIEIGSADAAGAFHAAVAVTFDRTWNRAASHVIAFVQQRRGAVVALTEIK